MTCNTPPATTCEDANTLRVFNTSGTCGGGHVLLLLHDLRLRLRLLKRRLQSGFLRWE